MLGVVLCFQCQTCKADISAEDCNLVEMCFQCRFCGAAFTFSVDPLRARQAPVSLPSHFALKQSEERLMISWRLFRARPLFSLWLLLGLAFLWASPWILLDPRASASERLWFELFLFFSAVVCSGAVLVKLFRRNAVSVASLRPKGGDPYRSTAASKVLLLSQGGRAFPGEEIQQLFCFEQKHYVKDGSYSTYGVYLSQRNGAVIPLLGPFSSPAQALFLEQIVEERLGLRGTPEPGEAPRM